MSEYIPNEDKTVWLVFDQSNGHAESRRYVWWFDSREAARQHKLEHCGPDKADLSHPIPFVRVRRIR